jgi:hypothetical protein
MHHRTVVVSLILLLCLPAAAAAQHGSAAPSRTPPREATQFDFLVGQWELTVRPKATTLAARLHGAPRLLGVWKAWRAFDGWGIEDELRITDPSGNPMALTHAMRAYDAAARAWAQSTFDVYRGRFTSATAEWKGTEMLVTSRGADQDGRTYQARMRFYDITPTTFKVRQDRSLDEGKTWDEAVLTMEAKRVAAAAAR